MADTTRRLVQILLEILKEGGDRSAQVRLFQRIVWDTSALEKETPCWGVLRDLANDLDYYVSDPSLRAEDPSYYGENGLEQEVRTALKRLKEMGIMDATPE